VDRVNIGIVGTGARGVFAFTRPLTEHYADRVNIMALCDRNEVRLNIAKESAGEGARTFTDYDEFLKQDDLDAVIVATPDHTHADLTVRALESGKHVYCEKPMATQAGDCRRMVEAAERCSRILQVGLNLRYTRIMQQLIDLVRRGDVGEVIMASATETLEGGGHFARWHRKKEYTGGILLQKGCHTLDLLNWVIGQDPVKVAGFGGRDVFKPREECRDRRCLDCPEAKTCPHYKDIRAGRDGLYATFYLEAEKLDGYISDRCVYCPDADILDNAMLIVEYENGRRGAYNLSLFGADADRKFTIIGTDGKIEASLTRREITLYKRGTSDEVKYSLQVDTGGHGGGDSRLVNDFLDLIRSSRAPLSDARAGMLSTLVGLAGEQSIEEGREVLLSEL